jgi:hypothetical protein
MDAFPINVNLMRTKTLITLIKTTFIIAIIMIYWQVILKNLAAIVLARTETGISHYITQLIKALNNQIEIAKN